MKIGISESSLVRLCKAVAKVDVAFPAGVYGLDEKQNESLNELNDVVSILRTVNPAFEGMYENERQEHGRWQLDRMLKLGIITKEEFDREVIKI